MTSRAVVLKLYRTLGSFEELKKNPDTHSTNNKFKIRIPGTRSKASVGL